MGLFRGRYGRCRLRSLAFQLETMGHQGRHNGCHIDATHGSSLGNRDQFAYRVEQELLRDVAESEAHHDVDEFRILLREVVDRPT